MRLLSYLLTAPTATTSLSYGIVKVFASSGVAGCTAAKSRTIFQESVEKKKVSIPPLHEMIFEDGSIAVHSAS